MLEEPVYGVAAGQTAVLYDDAGCVVGSGVIAPVSQRVLVTCLSRICAIRQGEILKFRPTPADERPEGAIRRTVIPGQEKTETWPFPHKQLVEEEPVVATPHLRLVGEDDEVVEEAPKGPLDLLDEPDAARPSTTRRSGEAPPSTCSAPTCARSATARC